MENHYLSKGRNDTFSSLFLILFSHHHLSPPPPLFSFLFNYFLRNQTKKTISIVSGKCFREQYIAFGQFPWNLNWLPCSKCVFVVRYCDCSITVANSTIWVKFLQSLSICLYLFLAFHAVLCAYIFYASRIDMPIVQVHKHGVFPLAKNVSG